MVDYISAADFEKKMKAIFENDQWCRSQKEIDSVKLMCQVLESLGYSAGIKVLKENNALYDD